MKFKITDDNQISAFNYLHNKLRNDSTYLAHINDIDTERCAENELSNATVSHDALDAWCRKYLTSKQFMALRAALRKRQSRRNTDATIIELER